MTQNDTSPQDKLRALLAAPTDSGRFAGRKPWIIGVGVLTATALLLVLGNGGGAPAIRYVTEEATQGELVVTATATGTLQPTKSIDVGSELSGTLASVLAQENDVVKKGQLLAELDTAKLKDAVQKSAAARDAADAAVLQKLATVAEARASLSRMKQVAELSGGQVPSKTELDTAEATLQRAVADEASARAAVVQARATLKTDETNLAKATIRSPVDGVVLTRKVEPGQTVAAQMTTPVLFTLAEDLSKMELQVKVDEADVGNVKVGQEATFTVSAWPKRHFPASIRRVGLGSTTTDNVVTYKTILTVANDDLSLRPGMTATASIVTARRDKALLVPNGALRFTPPTSAGQTERSFVSRLLPGPPPGMNQKRPAAAAKTDEAQLWTLGEDGRPKPINIRTGLSNGRQTEVLAGDLKAGMAVITDSQQEKR